MAMPSSSNPITMDQMRTEWGISGSISMDGMYKGGSYVEDNILNTNIASSGAIDLQSFYDATETENLDLRNRWDNTASSYYATGVTDITDTSYNTNTSPSERIYQVRFRAGDGFCREISFYMHSNEKWGDITTAIGFYGGTTASGATNLIYGWNKHTNSSVGGGRTITIAFTSAGAISSISQSTFGPDHSIYTFDTDNSGSAGSYRWFRFGILKDSGTSSKVQHSFVTEMKATSGGSNVYTSCPQPKV